VLAFVWSVCIVVSTYSTWAINYLTPQIEPTYKGKLKYGIFSHFVPPLSPFHCCSVDFGDVTEKNIESLKVVAARSF
jgi:hypothetical protein